VPHPLLPYLTAIVFGGLAITASVVTPSDRAAAVFALLGTLAGYVLAKEGKT